MSSTEGSFRVMCLNATGREDIVGQTGTLLVSGGDGGTVVFNSDHGKVVTLRPRSIDHGASGRIALLASDAEYVFRDLSATARGSSS